MGIKNRKHLQLCNHITNSKKLVQVGLPYKSKEGKYYNSICIATSQAVKYYHKHFLYESDENWAEEGPEFFAFNDDKLGTVMNENYFRSVLGYVWI